MPGIAEIRRDVRKEFDTYLTAKLDPSARAGFQAIFDVTVGQFAKDAANDKQPVEVWKIPKFRAFILGQVKRIALEANKGALCCGRRRRS